MINARAIATQSGQQLHREVTLPAPALRLLVSTAFRGRSQLVELTLHAQDYGNHAGQGQWSP